MTPDLFWLAVYLYLILLAWFCIVFSQTLIYIFQIKEYRFDRLISQIKESGISILTSNFGKRGAVTVRNSLIVILSIGLFVLFNIATSLMLLQITATPPPPCYHPENPLLCDGAGSGLSLRIPGLNAQNFI
ncbi:hypothetical protein HYS00_01170, partial [Candidatus Microgenomates bacterium]|nr:hypothetical protein [Candidatus Microgenomates bacterium]